MTLSDKQKAFLKIFLCLCISCDSVQNNKLGPGFRNSILYYMAKPYILQRDKFVTMKVPEWLLNSMSVV